MICFSLTFRYFKSYVSLQFTMLYSLRIISEMNVQTTFQANATSFYVL